MVPGVEVVAAGAERLWNTVMLSMPEFQHVRWLTKLDRLGVEVSTGSACSTGSDSASRVLAAMRYREDRLKQVLRVSAGPEPGWADWASLTEAIVNAYSALNPDGVEKVPSQ